MAAISAMPQDERINAFVGCANAEQRAFIQMGKLYRSISAALTIKQSITVELRKAGVKLGTISNASYAAKVFDLVEADGKPGVLTEAQYDSFTFGDCLAIVRAMSSGSKARQTAEQIAARVKKGKDFQPDLDALYNHGITAFEKKAADLAAESSAKADKAEKEKADAAKKLADAAEAKRVAAELETLRQQNETLRQQQSDTAEIAPVVGPSGDKPAPATTSTASTSTSAPAAPAAPAAGKIIPMDSAPKKRTAADLCEALDAVFSDMAALSAKDQKVVAAKLVELAAVVADPAPNVMPIKAAKPATKKKAA